MSYSLAFSQAVLILAFVADKMRLSDGEYVSARAIAEALGIPGPSVSKIVHALAGQRLLETREGAKGGVRLALEPEHINLDAVFVAIEQNKPLFPTHNGVRARGDRPAKVQRAISGALLEVERAMRAQLVTTTLASVLSEPPARADAT